MTLIEELQRAFPAFVPGETQRNTYLSVYASHKCYGGPEEGGWWYTTTVHVGSIQVDCKAPEFPALTEAVKNLLKPWNGEAKAECDSALAALPDPDIHGGSDDPPRDFVGDCTYFVHVETIKGSLDTTGEPAPHYE